MTFGNSDIAGRAIVAGEDEDGIVGETFGLHCVHDATDAAVERTDHGRVDAGAMRFDVADGVVVGLGGLQRRVHAPFGDIEEEGPVSVGVDDLDRLVGPPVSEIAAGLEPRAFIVGGGVLHARPEEFVDRIEGELGVDDVGVVLRQVERARHQEAFIEPLRVGAEFRAEAEMPFADMDRVVAGVARALRRR